MEANPAAHRLELYPTMRLQRLGSIAVVQPVWQGEVAGPSLTCDLETGTLAQAEHPKVGDACVPMGVCSALPFPVHTARRPCLVGSNRCM